jgi:hypothetical protein
LFLDAFAVPDAALGLLQVKVRRSAFSQVVVDLAAIHLDGVAVAVEDREDDAAVQVFVAFLAVDAEFGELRFQVLPGLGGLGHAVAEGAVGVADLEAFGGLGVEAFALGEILHGLRLVEEGGVVKVGDDVHQAHVAEAVAGIGEDVMGGAGVGHDGLRLGDDAEFCGELVGGTAEADLLDVHHQLDVVASPAPGEAVPKVFVRCDGEGRLVVLMERALAKQVLAAARKLNAVIAAEVFKRDFALDALNEFFG